MSCEIGSRARDGHSSSTTALHPTICGDLSNVRSGLWRARKSNEIPSGTRSVKSEQGIKKEVPRPDRSYVDAKVLGKPVLQDMKVSS